MLDVAARVKARQVYLVGFMGAGKTTVARALGRRLGLARRGHRRAHRGARAAVGGGDLRPARRALLPSARAAGAQRAAAAAPCVVATGGGTFAEADNRALMLADGAVAWLDVPLAAVHRAGAADGRRPLAADRAQMEQLYFSAASWPTPRRTSASTRRAGARSRRAAAGVDRTTDALSVLSDIHANLEALEAVARPRSGRCDAGARARRSRRLRRRSERRDRPRARAADRGHHPRQSRQGRRRARRRWTASTTCAARDRAGRRACSRRRTAPGWPTLPAGPRSSTTRRDLPRRAVRRGRLHLRRPRCAARVSRSTRPLCLFGHTHVPACSGSDGDRTLARIRARTVPTWSTTADPRRRYSGQLRRGRPAARRRPARRLRHARHRTAHGDAVRDRLRRRRRRRRRSVAAGLPEVLAQRLASGGRAKAEAGRGSIQG